MGRSECWNSEAEIKRRLKRTSDPSAGAGPVLYIDPWGKYSDDSESHIAVVGCTGKGKTQCGSHPFIREILHKRESLVMVDPKGEGYQKNACYIPEDYQVFCLDFRHPGRSPTKWNPLRYPYQLYASDDPDDNDIASSILSELCSSVYPYDGQSDKFWTDASINYAKGITYSLFEKADKEQINLDSVAVMMEQSETRVGISSLLKSFYQDLPSGSLAKRNLATYVTAPEQTRACIHSTASAGLEVFSRSKGLMEMLSDDTLNIMDMDVTRPFALFIITPDETDVYDSLSGLLVSQFCQHLIRVAQERGGRLPIRVNIILEELGSVGRSIPALPNLMVAGRSRNIRLMLVLQSNSQLIDVYGKSKAETINSCIGITIGFSTNSWETLTEWSHRCGERQITVGGHLIKEPLITAAQLAAMPSGTALIMVDNRYKFITHLPFYDEMYDNSGWKPPQLPAPSKRKTRKPFDLQAMVTKIRNSHLDSKLSGRSAAGNEPKLSNAFLFAEGPGKHVSADVDHFVPKIEPKMPDLGVPKKAEQNLWEGSKKYHVLIVNFRNNQEKILQRIADAVGESLQTASKRLNRFPIDIPFDTKEDAMKFIKDIDALGGVAGLKA